MLQTLTIKLERPETELTYNISTLMHGVLMEFVPEEYGENLHQDGLKPYSQHISFNEEFIIWTIHVMSDEAGRFLIEPLLNDNVSEIYIKHKDLKLKIPK